MPYAPEHKERSHARIVNSALRLFRRQGFGGTGIDRLMQEAGLTRGGFYAHFRSKSALFSESICRGFDEAAELLFAGGLEELRGSEWALAAAERYLSWSHRAAPESGCVCAALAVEVSRAPLPVRRAFSDRLSALVDRTADTLGGPDARSRAWALLSAWIGAIILARAVSDGQLAQEILNATARSLRRDA